METVKAGATEAQVVIVDDDVALLTAIELRLRNEFSVVTATNAAGALEYIRNLRVGVVVADMQMPGKSGIELLDEIKRLSPDVVRIILTGTADLEVAIDAINRGEVFRFLKKPYHADQLAAAIRGGLNQYELTIARRELLNGTLTGSMGLLADVLSIYAPTIFARLSGVRAEVRQLANKLCGTCSWELECAAAVSLIGYIGLPESLIQKIGSGLQITQAEAELVDQHAEIGARLIRRIPRMESVASIVLYQCKSFDGTGLPRDSVAGEQIPLGARILKVCLDVDQLLSQGLPIENTIAVLEMRKGVYCPHVLIEYARMRLGHDPLPRTIELRLQDLRAGLILASPVFTDEGSVLVRPGTILTDATCERLRDFANRAAGVREPILVKGCG